MREKNAVWDYVSDRKMQKHAKIMGRRIKWKRHAENDTARQDMMSVCVCVCECVLCTCVYLHACVCITEVSEHWSPLPNLPSCWSDTIMPSTEVFNWELCVWSGWCYHLTQGLELDLLSLPSSLSLSHSCIRHSGVAKFKDVILLWNDFKGKTRRRRGKADIQVIGESNRKRLMRRKERWERKRQRK